MCITICDHNFLSCACLSQQQQAEEEEEYITNRLMKRLETLKQEKEDLARQVAQLLVLWDA